MKWEDLSQETRDVMADFGDIVPIKRPSIYMVSGVVHDRAFGGFKTVHYTTRDLRKIASAFTEVADWLDKRAEEDKHGLAKKQRHAKAGRNGRRTLPSSAWNILVLCDGGWWRAGCWPLLHGSGS